MKGKTSVDGAPMRRLLRAHALWAYFALTFLLSWSLWVPMALDHYSLLATRMNPTFVQLGRLLGTLGPALSATIIAGLASGWPGVRDLWGQLKRWWVAGRWYAAAVLVFPALIFVVAGLYSLLPGAGPLPFQPVTVGNLIAVAIILTISVTGEEVGWRGFALPRLLERFPGLPASLIMGTIHTLWHLPFWVVLGELETFGPGYWLISWVYVCALSIYLTWLVNASGNRLVMPLLVHWSVNIISVGFLPITTLIPAYLIFAAITWAIALGLVRVYGVNLAGAPPRMRQPEHVTPA